MSAVGDYVRVLGKTETQTLYFHPCLAAGRFSVGKSYVEFMFVGHEFFAQLRDGNL